jgi:hypothetical protein
VSRQFGTDQTSLFAVTRTGQLGVFSIQDKGRWKQTNMLGPIGLAHPGAPLAALQQFGAKNQTDVFLIAQNGQLNLFWAAGMGDCSFGKNFLQRRLCRRVTAVRCGKPDERVHSQ